MFFMFSMCWCCFLYGMSAEPPAAVRESAHPVTSPRRFRPSNHATRFEIFFDESGRTGKRSAEPMEEAPSGAEYL
jgi:hypothetical protein